MTRHLRVTRNGLLLAAVLAPLLLHPGCGGTNPLTGERQPERSIIAEEEWALEPFHAFALDIRISGLGSGTVDATAEWTFASDDVNLYVTATACTLEMLATERCSYRARAESPTTKPERVTFGVSAGDSYRFWIVNFGPQMETGTLVVGLTQ